MVNETEEFEFRARSEKEGKMFVPEAKPEKPDLKGALDARMEEQKKVGAEARRGAALPFWVSQKASLINHCKHGLQEKLKKLKKRQNINLAY